MTQVLSPSEGTGGTYLSHGSFSIHSADQRADVTVMNSWKDMYVQPPNQVKIPKQNT